MFKQLSSSYFSDVHSRSRSYEVTYEVSKLWSRSWEPSEELRSPVAKKNHSQLADRLKTTWQWFREAKRKSHLKTSGKPDIGTCDYLQWVTPKTTLRGAVSLENSPPPENELHWRAFLDFPIWKQIGLISRKTSVHSYRTHINLLSLKLCVKSLFEKCLLQPERAISASPKTSVEVN